MSSFIMLPAQRNATLSIRKIIRVAYLSYFSKPAADRVLYRWLRQYGPRTILELGIGSLARSTRLIEMAVLAGLSEPPRYTGIDLFEGRSDSNPGVPLKRAHQVLSRFDVPVRLLPGEPCSVLSRHANSINGVEFLLIGRDFDPAALQRAWLFIPRMLAEKSVVVCEETGSTGDVSSYHLLTPADIQTRLDQARRLRRTAA